MYNLIQSVLCLHIDNYSSHRSTPTSFSALSDRLSSPTPLLARPPNPFPVALVLPDDDRNFRSKYRAPCPS